jgi:hypothetical protein
LIFFVSALDFRRSVGTDSFCIYGHLWRELSLEARLDRIVRRSRGDTAPLSDRALVLLAIARDIGNQT